jgi:hypothetical protein
MKFFGKALGLTLAALALSSCGGGGGNGGTFTPVSGTIELSATTTTLPANTSGYLPHDHGPNQAEVTITIRNPDGTLMVGHDVQVSISPVQVAALSFLVGDGNDKFDNLWGTFTIKGTNGVATAWVNAGTTTGTATLTASTIDPTTSRTISKTLTFTVTGGVGPLPASVALTPSSAAVYLPSSGGNSTAQIQATVRDGANQFVPDPAGGSDNIQFEIIGTPGDAILSTNSASGAATGTKVTSHTVHGVATVAFQAGEHTPQGSIQVRATVDRADNNVSNGIQDAVMSTSSLIVSDGKLYSIELTSPVFAPSLPGITINSVSGAVTTDQQSQIPADPDATLTLTVTALAKDRQGNPPIPGTPIRFGLVDEPVGAPGTANDNVFLLSGTDGNPQEGGKLFTAPTGRFTTAGVNGANSGDALVVFGSAVDGNADLESAATVTSVNSATSLNVTPAFNYNYRTDLPYDSGSILPYLIGRAVHGNVIATATTDASGIAHSKVNYTVNTVGSVFALWAQGDGIDRVNGGARRVTAAGTLVYPGVAPATISASPDPIMGDTTDHVTVCVTDALGIPLRGLQVGFAFHLSGGTGTIDGKATGVFASLTGVNGCATGTVVTSGVPASDITSGNSGTIALSAAGKTTSVGVAVQIATLQVSPNSVSVPADGVTASIKVTARTATGVAVPATPITGACTASPGSITLTPTSGVTGNDGVATFAAKATGFVTPGNPHGRDRPMRLYGTRQQERHGAVHGRGHFMRLQPDAAGLLVT